MNSKICSRCKLLKPIQEFCLRNKDKNVIQARCRICTRAAIKDHYYRNREYYLAKTRKRNKFLLSITKTFIVKYLQKHSCVDCGEKDIVVLDFDHMSDKTDSIALMRKRRLSLKVIKNEIEKCEVRCANCHRRKTALKGKWYKN